MYKIPIPNYRQLLDLIFKDIPEKDLKKELHKSISEYVEKESDKKEDKKPKVQ